MLAGSAVGLATVVELKPVDGLQTYELAPLAVMIVPPDPWQTFAGDGLIVMDTEPPIIIVAFAVFVQPEALVPVTV